MRVRWYKLLKQIAIALGFVVMQSASFGAANIEGIQVYQKNLHMSDEHKQKLANDIDRYHNADNLWDILSEEFSLPHYEDNPFVQEQIEFFLHHQEFLAQATGRAGPYLYFILQQARKRHLPAEVVLLPMIESAYNPFAYSSAGAAGMWQMMPGTASGYGIKQDWWYDGRRDVVASTRAALDYLAYLGSFFEGNWLLAIAAYDTGEGNILSAIRKNNRAGKNTDFWSLPVAQETRIYIPRLLALAIIISHPEQYPIALPAVPNAPYLAQVDVGSQIDLQIAASLANMSLKNMKRLNPAYKHQAVDSHGPSKLILPIENVAQFTENLARAPLHANMNPTDIDEPIYPNKTIYSLKHSTKPANTVLVSSSGHYTMQPGDTLYMARKGDTVEKIAKRYHADAKNILAANRLSHKKKINMGDRLIVPTHAVTQQIHHYALSPGDTIYMVRKNDTIEKIATKFHIAPSAIRINNLLSSNTVHEGDRLVIPSRLS